MVNRSSPFCFHYTSVSIHLLPQLYLCLCFVNLERGRIFCFCTPCRWLGSPSKRHNGMASFPLSSRPILVSHLDGAGGERARRNEVLACMYLLSRPAFFLLPSVSSFIFTHSEATPRRKSHEEMMFLFTSTFYSPCLCFFFPLLFEVCLVMSFFFLSRKTLFIVLGVRTRIFT